ncbi:anaerobic sulfite reductase subunit B [Bacilli bacterium PM5-3]|nr:anaerobic sulfite reductase subunit B [Bacilli bacterium PM5-3]MDH6603970.1 anaerobic sulfite reductase subunit B [Bacilli bacterium PM5-9]
MNNIYMPLAHKIIDIKQESAIEWLFVVEFSEKCQPGQFVEVSLPKVGEAPISITKVNNGDNTIELLIRKVGRVTDALFDLKVGDNLFLRGPYGNGFDLDKMRNKEVIVISGGSGLAPVRPIVREFYQNSSFRLLAGFKDLSGILFKEELDMWQAANKNVHVTLDCDNEICLVGFVTDHIDMILEGVNKDNCCVIVVGPPLMMKFTTQTLLNNGIAKDDIIVSFERNMSCAVGKCGHCKIDETYVCLEGPVFAYPKAEKLLD